MHVDLGKDLDTGRVLDVACQQALGTDSCQCVRAPDQHTNNGNHPKHLEEKAPPGRRQTTSPRLSHWLTP